MEDTKLNLGNGREIPLALTFEPETGLPCWVTEMDALYLHMLAMSFYDYAKTHPITITGSNLENKGDFTFTQKYNDFDASILTGEVNMFKDLVKILKNTIITAPDGSASFKCRAMNISLFGKGDSDAYLIANISDEYIRIDARA